MGYMGHWTATRDIKRGVTIYLNGRPMFIAIPSLTDCQITPDSLHKESTWSKCVTELLERMNQDNIPKDFSK